jgi:ABC-2 type transport system ATP-binding protein
MNSQPAILIRGLCKTFDMHEVISNCSMTVEKGKIYGFLGKNGAGKTTIFKILTGLQKPTMGEVNVLGTNIMTKNTDYLRYIGSLIETPIFYDHLSAAQNLEVHLEYMNLGFENIDNTLNMVGLSNTSNMPVSQFSLGMRQRLAIARAMIHKPKLLILDEPINGLDPIGIRYMRDLFRQYVNDNDATIILSSHILSEIESVADVIGVIADGKIIKESPMNKIKSEHKNDIEDYLINLMNGDLGNEKTYVFGN